MKFFFASLLAIAPTYALSQTATCPVGKGQELSTAEMNPAGIQQYLTKYAEKLKSVEDVVCCLPQVYRDQFAIMHSSNSAQHSDLFGPRAILFDIEPGNDRFPVPQLKCAISFNGGEAHFGNPHNLELMCDNKSTSEIELFDVAQRNGKFELGERNPQACVSCHGSAGKIGFGGLRPIFEDIDNWTRAVQGTHACGSEETLSRALERATQSVFNSNRRYKCLNQTVAKARHFSGSSSSTAPDLTTLDLTLMRLNARRTARVLRGSKNYEQFQFALLGSLLCMDDGINGPGKPWNTGENFDGWIPEKVLSQMTGTDWLPTEFAEHSDPPSLIREKLLKSAAQFTTISIGQLRAVNDLESGKKPEFDFYRGPLNTCNDMKYQIEKIVPPNVGTSTEISTLDRYKAASVVQGFRGARPNPHFRFLLESRGIHAGDFSMDLVGSSYNRSTDLLAAEILVNAPQGSAVQKIGLEFLKSARKRAAKLGSSPSSTKRGTSTEESAEQDFVKRTNCSQLKKLSLEAFKRIDNKGDIPAPAVPRAVQR